MNLGTVLLIYKSLFLSIIYYVALQMIYYYSLSLNIIYLLISCRKLMLFILLYANEEIICGIIA